MPISTVNQAGGTLIDADGVSSKWYFSRDDFPADPTEALRERNAPAIQTGGLPHVYFHVYQQVQAAIPAGISFQPFGSWIPATTDGPPGPDPAIAGNALGNFTWVPLAPPQAVAIGIPAVLQFHLPGVTAISLLLYSAAVAGANPSKDALIHVVLGASAT